MKRAAFAFWSVLVVGQGACMASGPSYTEMSLSAPPRDKARIVVLRDGELFGSGQSAAITVDHAPLGPLRNDGFLFRDVKPGHHLIRAGDLWGASQAELDVAPGRTAYVRVSPAGWLAVGKPALAVDGISGVAFSRAGTRGFFDLGLLNDETAERKLVGLSLSR